MTEPDVVRVAAEHARRLAAGDAGALDDIAPGASVEPPDLLHGLLIERFGRFDVVAHARIGAYHIFKTKLVGSRTVVVQARWAQDAAGRWRIAEAEVARVASQPDP